MQRGWTSTIFVLNLAVADLLYCTVDLTIFAMIHLGKKWIWGENCCFFVAAIVLTNTITEWGSLGMIAVSKCVGLLHSELAEKLFTGFSGKWFVAMIWIYGQIYLIPAYLPDYFQV